MRASRFLILVLIAFSMLTSCLNMGDGTDRIIKEIPNNKHNKKAVLFLREAGATVGDSYQLSIVDYKETFDTTAVGNTFTFDDDHGKARLDPKCIDIKWPSNDTVELRYDKMLRTFIQEKAVDGVTIVYKTK